MSTLNARTPQVTENSGNTITGASNNASGWMKGLGNGGGGGGRGARIATGGGSRGRGVGLETSADMPVWDRVRLSFLVYFGYGLLRFVWRGRTLRRGRLISSPRQVLVDIMMEIRTRVSWNMRRGSVMSLKDRRRRLWERLSRNSLEESIPLFSDVPFLFFDPFCFQLGSTFLDYFLFHFLFVSCPSAKVGWMYLFLPSLPLILI